MKTKKEERKEKGREMEGEMWMEKRVREIPASFSLITKLKHSVVRCHVWNNQA